MYALEREQATALFKKRRPQTPDVSSMSNDEREKWEAIYKIQNNGENPPSRQKKFGFF